MGRTLEQDAERLPQRSGGSRRREPRYAVIANYLIGAIESGALAVGDALPSEAQLCEDFKASRFTVRQALRDVEDEGLISRRHGSGRRVIAARRAPRYALTRRTDTDLLHYTELTTLELLAQPAAPMPARAAEIRLGTGAGWAVAPAIRTAGGQPIAFLEIYVLDRLASVLMSLPKPVEQAIYMELAEKAGLDVCKVDEVVSATRLPEAAAEAVGALPGSPALKIVRRFSSIQDGLFEVSVSLHPGDRFEYALSFDRLNPPVAAPTEVLP
jgi:DNA-binding GntR family transcriptional regulator